MQIVVGVVKGLKYFYCVINFFVIYSDLKIVYILLDYDFKLKIFGFGFVKFGLVVDMCFYDFMSFVINGYWVLEYVNNGDELILKYDIYSFGVVMLEFIIGCKFIEDLLLGL